MEHTSPSKETLYGLYHIKHKSLHEIGKILNLNYNRILNLFIQYNIPRRTPSESWKFRNITPEIRSRWTKNLKEHTKVRRKKKPCFRCEKEFDARVDYGTLEYTRRKYCSKKCASVGRKCREDTKDKMRVAKIGCKNPNYDGGKTIFFCKDCGREVVSYPSKSKYFCSHKCNLLYRIKKLGNTPQPRPTKPELKFIEIINKYKLPYKYVGDGKFWLEGLNPDFVNCDGKKICVEIFGEYWHSPLLIPKLSYARTFTGRMKIYKKYGWKCIILWESELKNEEIIMKKLNGV